jgi:RNA polymerase sigma-70 factor (ECF subfamily)
MSMSDEELVRRFRAGDDRALAELYERHHAWIASLAARFCGDADAALDVLQDAFAYLVRKRADLKLRAAFRSFLYPVVKHLALNRKRAERPVSPLTDVPAPAAAPGGVEDLLSGLSDAQQEVVRMRFTDGLDLQAIADALEVPLGTVKSRLHSALEILRGRLPNR